MPLKCVECGEIMPDVLDGDTSSEKAREFLSQCQSRERCAHCFDAYKKTTSLCRDALRNETEAQSDEERLLAVLRSKLEGGDK